MTDTPRCRVDTCRVELVVGKNWTASGPAKKPDRICRDCVSEQDPAPAVGQAEAKEPQHDAHVRDYQVWWKVNPICKECGEPLIVGENWAVVAARWNNRICRDCYSKRAGRHL